jgi:hypothetical protein
MKIFAGGDLYQYLEQGNRELEQEVTKEEKNHLLNVDEAAYIDYLVGAHTIETVNFNWDAIYATESEKPIPSDRFPRDIMMGIGYQQQGSLIKQVITYHLPFSGLHILLQMKPSNNCLLWTTDVEFSKKLDEVNFEVINWKDDSQAITSESSQIIENIKHQSNSVNEQVRQYNVALKNRASNAVIRRKTELLKQSNLLESLGVPIKRADNVAESFSVPIKKKQIVIQKPLTSDKAFVPEPVLDKQVYWQILKTCHDLGVEMERHPSIYKGKGEEALRDLFLMMLSPNFDSVTGETFNKQGKTDILIKHEGKNIFVAECKFWHGSKLHHETINQILSYLTWRESKAAIIYFLDNKNLQPVLDGIESESPKHPCYVNKQNKNGEAWFNYHFHLLSDNTRGVELAILVFHLND